MHALNRVRLSQKGNAEMGTQLLINTSRHADVGTLGGWIAYLHAESGTHAMKMGQTRAESGTHEENTGDSSLIWVRHDGDKPVDLESYPR